MNRTPTGRATRKKWLLYLAPGIHQLRHKSLGEGLIFIIARLDDETGIQVGHDLDINVFQGFYVDDLLDGKIGKATVT